MTTPTITPVASPIIVNGEVAIAVSKDRMIAILMDSKGATPITIIAHTEPKMRKTANPFYGRIYKASRVNGMVNFQYDAGVLRRLENEGKSADNFRQGQSWHEAVLTADGKLTPFCKHKQNGEYYLRFMLRGTIQSEYRWIADDQPLTDSQLDNLNVFIQKSDYSNQGLTDPLVFLTYKMESIKIVTVNKQTYMVG